MLKLTKRADYLHCAKGKKVHTKNFSLQVLSKNSTQEAEQQARFGLTVSRHCGNAVKRNRIKRRFREIVREHAPIAAMNTDYVVVARAQALDATYEELTQQFLHALTKNANTQKVKQ